MSYLSVSNRYSMYSDLISQTYATGSKQSSSADSLLGMYSYIYGSNSGTSVSSQTSSYLVDLKESASDVISAVKNVKERGKDTKNISANSDSASVSATYKGKEMRDDIDVEVSKVASAQTNESKALKSNSSSLYYSKASGISISTSDGKSYSFNYSPSVSETDEKALNKIAQKINKAGIGVSASVETDSKTKTSKLVLKGEKTGSGNDFSVSGSLAEAIGIDKVKEYASDAIYSINGEEKVSSSNNIKVDDELSIVLNKPTDGSAKITFGKSKLDTINSARQLVNAFNDFANAAYSSSDSGAERLGNRLKSLASTYGASLKRIGISMTSKGYLQIDEDKMKEAADNGDLDRFFDSNGKKGLSYGFTNRLENLADKAFDDPTSFLSNQGKTEVNSAGGSSSYYGSNSGVSYNYLSAYYRYSTTALLFNAMI